MNITRELKNMNVLRHIDTMFTAQHIVSAASSPGRRLVQAMWLCRGLGQAWRLPAAKGVEKSESKKERQFEELKYKRENTQGLVFVSQ